MKRSVIVLFFFALSMLAAKAQSVQEGISNYYAERYASARTTFDKLLAANPNNIEAIYWLGQTYIATDKVNDAQQLYSKAISTNGNVPLILAGLGHVELIEKKTADARQHFETAISLSRGKKGDDPVVINAIGRANVEAPNGDIAYAVSKLNSVADKTTNGDLFITLGNAYRRAHEGGQAIVNYTKAAQALPALAYYRMARVYETQRNWDVVTEYLNKSIAADQRFAPAYLRMYVYDIFYKSDCAGADQWAKKYIAAADPSIQNEYFRAQALFCQKNYDEAISVANKIFSTPGETPSASAYRLMAYSYLEKRDTATARRYVDQLFEKTKKDELVAKDYTLKATIYSKESPGQVVQTYMEALEGDTTLSNKLKILDEAIGWAKTNNRKEAEGDLRLARYNLDPAHNPASLFQIGLPFYQATKYQRADSVFRAYSAAFPDSIYGYLWSARSLSSIDTTMKQGLAIPQYEQILRVAATDKVRFKSNGIEAAGNLVQYYVNIKGDKAKGLEYTRRGLEFDPENATFKKIEQQLSSAPSRAPASPTKIKTEPNKTKVKTGK